MFQVALLASLLVTGNTAGFDSISGSSPACEDNDEATGCCPLEDLQILGNSLADWYACLESIATPPPETWE